VGAHCIRQGGQLFDEVLYIVHLCPQKFRHLCNLLPVGIVSTRMHILVKNCQICWCMLLQCTEKVHASRSLTNDLHNMEFTMMFSAQEYQAVQQFAWRAALKHLLLEERDQVWLRWICRALHLPGTTPFRVPIGLQNFHTRIDGASHLQYMNRHQLCSVAAVIQWINLQHPSRTPGTVVEYVMTSDHISRQAQRV
jgi:hypothetical protein